ncbi:MAG: efflux transporter outer membrane subunit [Gammaproteobacteria bacterium]
MQSCARRTLFGPALLAVLLGACSVGPDYRRPAAPLPDTFKELKGWKRAQPRDHELPGKWWEIFNDAQLNALEEQAALANQSLAQAEAQYRQAQALVQTARAAYSPVGTTTASVNRFRAASGENVAVSGVKYLYAIGLNAAWEPDLWGSVRRQVEAAEASAQASAATLQALRLSTLATLAQNYFQLRMLDAQKRLADDTVGAYAKTLSLTENRYAVGVAAKADVVQAETQLRSAQAEAFHIGVQRAQLEHAIALLSGKAPAELTIPPEPLHMRVPAIPLGIPSELLERRPDIAAAERQVAAANAKIGVAKAAYFPTLNLSANNGYQSNKLSELFSSATRYWALGPAALAFTLFDGGARSAEMKQARAAYDAGAAAYRQTVLNGFQEVEDNLAALRILEQEADVRNRAVAAAREAVVLATNQYKAGTVSYLNVTAAQTTAFSNERAAVELQGQRLSAAVLLVKALGGGWHTASLPSAEEAGGETRWYDYLPVPVD